MDSPDILLALQPIIECFDALHIPYQIGGSVASSAYGIPRTTLDVDLVVKMTPVQIRPLIEQLKNHPFDQECFKRRKRDFLGEEASKLECYFASPEDVILHKLLWYNMGGLISDRQWSDILGVMKVQGTGLDHKYLRKWAKTLGIDELLEKAFRGVNLTD